VGGNLRIELVRVISLAILGPVLALAVYTVWDNYSNFRHLLVYNQVWSWNSFYIMSLGLIVIGFILGNYYTIYSLYKFEREEKLRAAERQMLKEEIKKELEMERQREKAN